MAFEDDDIPWCPFKHPTTGEHCAVTKSHQHVDNGCGPELRMTPPTPKDQAGEHEACTCQNCPIHGVW